MATLRVYFFGLIAHVSDTNDHNTKDHASIMRTPQGHHPHVPVIFFEELFGRLIKPDVHEIRFGVPAQASVGNSFSNWVPSLEKLVGGQLAGYHKDRAVNVWYPEGGTRLSAAQLYDHQAHYANGPLPIPDQCVARATVATLMDAPDEIIVTARRKNGKTAWAETIFLDTDQCVFIGNIAAQGTDAERALLSDIMSPVVDEHSQADHSGGGSHAAHLSHGVPHTQTYGELLDNDGAATLNVSETSTQCSQIPFVGCSWIEALLERLKIKLTTGDTVECGNTQWP